MRVAVLGAGAGGLASATDLTTQGHDVALWHRSQPRLHELRSSGGIIYSGVLGRGQVMPAALSERVDDVLKGADVAVVCLPGPANAELFEQLAGRRCRLPIVLNPGQTGGALHLRATYLAKGAPPPAIAELSTLTYVARATGGRVAISGRAKSVRGAALPGGEEALEIAATLFGGVRREADVMATSLSNVNLVLHPPTMLLAAAWIEATGGGFKFYVDAMTPGTLRVLEALDAERRRVGTVWGHALPDLAHEMEAIGTTGPLGPGGLGVAIRRGEANANIAAPSTLEHRYFQEDLPFGLVPMHALAQVAGVDIPLAGALVELGRTLLGPSAFHGQRDLRRLGLEDLSFDQIRGLVGT